MTDTSINASHRVEELATLVREHNAVVDRISSLIGRPAQIGHVGEYIAGAIFDIDLNPSASTKGHDGFFCSPAHLAGRSVNIKWGSLFEGGMDVSPDAELDYYLAMVGPRARSMTSKGSSRPWLISAVYLFDAIRLRTALTTAGVKIGVATSIRAHLWESAKIYPEANNPILPLKPDSARSAGDVRPSASRTMSERLPRVSGKELVAALRRGGYDDIRQRGSHVHLRNPTRGGLVTVPFHGNEVLDVKIVKSALSQADLSVDELKELLR